MKKCILIPDSFKGTMSSIEVCRIMATAILRFFPDCDIIPVPVADGGEGSVDAFLTAIGGTRQVLTVKGPYFEDVEGFYAILSDGKTAVIEMAACAGLPLVGDDKRPEDTTTYGVGQLMLDAVQKGCTKIILGLGGSATNDGGCGAAAAVGVRFYNEKGDVFIPTGGTLSDIVRIDCNAIDARIGAAQVITMCDIDNPLCGKNGAAYVFGPQKGADEACVQRLDAGLQHMAQIVKRDIGMDVLLLPGSGAAGGMGGGSVAFFGSELQMGIDVVLDAVGFDDLLKGAELVLSGEGRIDHQTLRGKVVAGVAQRTKKKNIPLVAIVGDIGDDIEPLYENGVAAVLSINRVAKPYREVKHRAPEDLRLTVESLMRLLVLRDR